MIPLDEVVGYTVMAFLFGMCVVWVMWQTVDAAKAKRQLRNEKWRKNFADKLLHIQDGIGYRENEWEDFYSSKKKN